MGVDWRVGIPGRGADGAAAPGAVRACCKRATSAGLGGTTGRAVGWPARPGRTWARSGRLGDGDEDCSGAGCLGAAGRGCGVEGPGRGASAVATGDGAEAVGASVAGSGWRGPEMIWPGRGAGGTGLAGI